MKLGIDYSPHGLLAKYCMQCPDPVTGKTGSWAFIGESHKTGERISPIFDGLFPLLQWMHENGWELYRAGGLFSIRHI
jgi:hypothetical protein